MSDDESRAKRRVSRTHSPEYNAAAESLYKALQDRMAKQDAWHTDNKIKHDDDSVVHETGDCK